MNHTGDRDKSSKVLTIEMSLFPALSNQIFNSIFALNSPGTTHNIRNSSNPTIRSGASTDPDKSISQHSHHEMSSGYSRILTQNITYDWTIDNILSFQPEITTNGHPAIDSFIEVRSPTFSISGSGKPVTKWHLYMRFGGRKPGTTLPASHASIWLLLEKPSEPVKANFELQVLDEQLEPIDNRRSGVRTFDSDNNPWGFADFIPYTYFEHPDESIFIRNQLRIRLQLQLFLGTVNFSVPPRRIRQDVNFAYGDLVQTGSEETIDITASKSSTDMRTAISTLWKNEAFTDVEIMTKDKTISCHKAILAARSPVFSTMFSSKSFIESQNNEVNLDTFSSEVVEAMIQFIYTDQTDLLGDVEKASELLEMAEMYELPSLKYDCFVELMHKLDIKSAAKIAVISYYYKPTEEILVLIKDFVESNIESIKKTPGFKELFTQHHSAICWMLRESNNNKSIYHYHHS